MTVNFVEVNTLSKIIIAAGIFCSGYYLGGGCDKQPVKYNPCSTESSRVESLENRLNLMEKQAEKFYQKNPLEYRGGNE